MRPPRAILAYALLLLSACSSKDKEPARPHATVPTRPLNQPADSGITKQVSPVPSAARQLIVGVTPTWSSVPITLQRFERAADASWKPVGTSWPATIGYAGLGWGRGLHGDGAPKDEPGPTKVGGDGKSPAGVFSVSAAFGYAASPTQGASMPYTQATRQWRCVDDPTSKHYTRVVDETTVEPDWKSAEHLRRADKLYEWVIVIDHNKDAVPRGGSCIFFHVWGNSKGASVGCTAMARPKIEELLRWLDPNARPTFVQLPAQRYEALRAAWKLPSLVSPR